jgi:hypothetical protein
MASLTPHRLLRSATALVAAYAVVLQVLLTAVAVTQAAAAVAGAQPQQVICHSEGGEPASQQSSLLPCSICLSAPAFVPATAERDLAPIRATYAARLQVPSPPAPAESERPSPQTARGPPAHG